jgi:ornithine--oxo-acid transaminase
MKWTRFGSPIRLSFQAAQAIHPALFGQILVMRLFKDKNILTQICGNNFMVLKVALPLVVREQQLDECVTFIRDVVERMHSSAAFWSDALKLGRRAVSV